MSNIGLHFVDNIYTSAEINNHFDILQRVQPNYINVIGGMQHKEALQFAIDVRKYLPQIQVIFRHYKDGSDDGMHTRLNAKEWIDKIAKQYIGLDLIILTDNESVSDSMVYYSDWHSTALHEAQKLGLKLAVGRFATGNPDDGSKRKNQYPDLESMFHALAVTQSGIFSPNEYFEKINGGIGSIGRYRKAMYMYAKYEPIIPLKVVIGEYGFVDNYSAYNGYKSIGMDVNVYANELERHFLDSYFYNRIDVCLYCIGKWPLDRDTFGANEQLINRIVSFNQKLKIMSIPPIPPVIELPDEDTDEIPTINVDLEFIKSIKILIDDYISGY